ncbi:hypothetical protein C1H46_007328 [Malus baccata]|uniref:Uncharacterized protein n=1 Tax=Malus baccata TaxID=106549 RepID=A0A540N986_MALBA|nr:hypothetical protein C1H46_007328 [Malus baccata]
MHIAEKNTRGRCQLKTAKVTRVTNGRIMIGYDDQHRAAPTAEQHSALAHNIGHVIQTYCPMQWKSWKAMPDEVRMNVGSYLSTNYNFDDINDDMLAYVNSLFTERYRQWKSDRHQYFETFNDLQVTLEKSCPKEFEDLEYNWKKAKANKINRGKKTLLHHSSLRLFLYRMEAWRQGSKFPKIVVFGDVYVQPGDELAESLHAVGSSGVRLPASSRDSAQVYGSPRDAGFQIVTDTLDQTFGWRPRTYCRGMGDARGRELRAPSSSQSKGKVTTLTAEVVGLRTELASYKSQISLIVHTLSQSGVRLPDIHPPSTFEPLQPEHAQNSAPSTSEPVPNPKTFLPQDI